MAASESDTTGQWVGRAKSGDEAAFELLLRRHILPLEVFIRRSAGTASSPDHDVSDILSTVIGVAWTRLPEYEPRGPRSFYRWLVQIARNAISDRRKYNRRQGRDQVRGLKEDSDGSQSERRLVDDQTTAARVVARREEVARVMKALDRLPADDRALVIHHVLEGCSIRELSRATATSVATTFKQLRDALRLLRKLVDEAPDDAV